MPVSVVKPGVRICSSGHCEQTGSGCRTNGVTGGVTVNAYIMRLEAEISWTKKFQQCFALRSHGNRRQLNQLFPEGDAALDAQIESLPSAACSDQPVQRARAGAARTTSYTQFSPQPGVPCHASELLSRFRGLRPLRLPMFKGSAASLAFVSAHRKQIKASGSTAVKK